MTSEQRTTVELIKGYGYHVLETRRSIALIVLVTVLRKLTAGTLTLRVYPDGSYTVAKYDARNPGRIALKSWQS